MTTNTHTNLQIVHEHCSTLVQYRTVFIATRVFVHIETVQYTVLIDT